MITKEQAAHFERAIVALPGSYVSTDRLFHVLRDCGINMEELAGQVNYDGMQNGYYWRELIRVVHGIANAQPANEVKKEEHKVSSGKKYYKVLKPNWVWEVGCILEGGNGSAYKPLDGSDIWDVGNHSKNSSASCDSVENSPEWFERVYPVNLLTKTIYKVKAEALELMNKAYKEE